MFTLDQIVPWGRSFAEYRAMFSLSDVDLRGRILGCGDGPASFNAVASRLGSSVISCDPIYQRSADALRSRIEQTYETVMEQTRRNQQEFVWNSIPSVEELGRVRMAAMEEFLADYALGLTQRRYVNAQLPQLPFTDEEFDLALSSHLLFLYSNQLGADFHRESALELARVAREVRIFPLLALGGQRSEFVEPCMNILQEAGYSVTIERVAYEFQRGGNEMLRFSKRI